LGLEQFAIIEVAGPLRGALGHSPGAPARPLSGTLGGLWLTSYAQNRQGLLRRAARDMLRELDRVTGPRNAVGAARRRRRGGEARGLVAGVTDSQMGSLLRQPGCRLRARSRALLPDLGRDRRPGVLPVLPDDRIADEPQAVLPLFHLARLREGHWLADGRFAPPRSRHRHGGRSRSV
jgi:hypothetical protein